MTETVEWTPPVLTSTHEFLLYFLSFVQLKKGETLVGTWCPVKVNPPQIQNDRIFCLKI